MTPSFPLAAPLAATPAFTLAIIGGGFAGTCLACQAQASLPPDARILLFEASGPAGPGLAYGTEDPAHLLNVPAGGMSLWPDRPADFPDWLARQPDRPSPPAGGGPVFAPRYLYGRYLMEALEAAKSAPGAVLQVVPRAVTTVSPAPVSPAPVSPAPVSPTEPPPTGAGFLLRDADGVERQADAVVLAIGGFAAGAGSPPHLFGNPWDPAALEGLDPEAPILLVGLGLTMVDLLLSLRRQGHRGTVLAASRHGWLPLPHLEGAFPPAWPFALPEGTPMETTPAEAAPLETAPLEAALAPAALSRLLRQEAARAAAAGTGTPWQSVIDGFRPLVQRVWRGWGPARRRSFLRHGRTAWNLHRHRLPPEATRQLREALAEGTLQVVAGRLESWRAAGEGCLTRLRLRDGSWREEQVARIILCTGPDGGSDWRQALPMPDLLAQGLAMADPLGMAPAIDAESRAVLGADGKAVPALYMVGPLTRGALWEATAVPEIRGQATALSILLSGIAHDRPKLV